MGLHVSNVSVQWGREEQVGAKIQTHLRRFGGRFYRRSGFCQQKGLSCVSNPAVWSTLCTSPCPRR